MLGSNLGDRRAHLAAARRRLEASGAIIRAASAVRETEPFGLVDQPWFLNQALAVDWAGTAADLRALVKNVEQQGGRTPGRRWGPRKIDIDIALFGEEVIDEPDLHVPHLGLTDRAFFLEPLLEIDPDLRDPRSGRTLREVLDHILGS